MTSLRALLPAAVLLLAASPSRAKTMTFAGLEWEVKSGDGLGPGPNIWSDSNAWVDRDGRLHLKISWVDGTWRCAEVSTRRRFHFGKYEFFVSGPLDRLDKNVVLGLFNYRPGGPDKTNEIDIEFAQWGNSRSPRGSYAVWPAAPGLRELSSTFDVRLNGSYTTHRWRWDRKSVRMESLHGHRRDDSHLFAERLFNPADPRHIPQEALPVHLNLWLFEGREPSDRREAEVVITDFRWSPLDRSGQ